MDCKKHLLAASGYVELGLHKEAAKELDQIEADKKLSPEVALLQIEIFRLSKKWKQMQRFSEALTQKYPKEPQWWILLGYATRRANSLEAAHEVLLQAEKLHPEEPTIQFNLGCYECQLGNIELAKQYVHRAITLNKDFQKLAIEDSDLEPLWQNIQRIT